MKKKFASLLLVSAMAVSLVGCGNGAATEEAEQQAQAQAVELRELAQNDYRGGVKRTLALRDSIIGVLDEMKANNNVIRESVPNSYWTTEGYQDFVSTFLDIMVIDDTIWLNEEETDWDTILEQYLANPRFGDGETLTANFTRVEKDEYIITNVPVSFELIGTSIIGNEIKDYDKQIDGTAIYRVLYDCDKDWGKVYVKMPLEDTQEIITQDVCLQLFEYRRIDDNTFAVQTSRERLLVKLNPSEESVPISQRKINEFYYSKLHNESMRTTYEPYRLLPEKDLFTDEALEENINRNTIMKDNPYINENGEFAQMYSEKNSLFFHSNEELNTDWVFEDKSLSQAICYKDGALVVTTYNKLSTNYERFVYAKSDVKNEVIDKLETLVEIDGLVGVLDKETADELIGEDETEATTEDTTEEMTEESSEESTEETSETDVSAETTEKKTIFDEIADEQATAESTEETEALTTEAIPSKKN